jgi:hypothetical protein
MTDPAIAALQNVRTFDYYFQRLQNIALSVYEWKDLPDTVDPRWLELSICLNGMCLFFKDDVLGYLALPCTIGSPLDVYNIPMYRRAYAANGYQAERNNENSVIIYHNYLHQVPIWDLEMFATRLADYQRTIDINVNAQKTPIALLVDDTEKATWENAYMSYVGNVPVIIGNKAMNPNSMQVLKTDAPFIADAVEELRTMVWNDAMSYIGISNVNVTKKERLITDEVQRNMGGVLASRYSPLEMRRHAAKQINKMFNLDISVDFREDILAYQSQIIGETEEMIKDGELADVADS